VNRWLISAIVVLVFLLGIVVFGLYQYGGGRYYLEIADLVNQKTGEEKTKLKKEVFGDSAENKYGGIFVGVIGEGFWVWGDKGLKYFHRQDNKTVFFWCRGLCQSSSSSAYSNWHSPAIAYSSANGNRRSF